MMNYEIFKEVVAEKFMDYLPAQYQGMKIDVHPVEKVNVTMDAINLLGDGAGISPTIYINDMLITHSRIVMMCHLVITLSVKPRFAYLCSSTNYLTMNWRCGYSISSMKSGLFCHACSGIG